MLLEGRIALVTGSSRGIGRSVAIALAEGGADVVVTYRSREEKAREVVEIIKDMGRKVEMFKVDVSSEEEVNRLKEEVFSVFGGVDILVNNAGIVRDALFMNMDTEKWRVVIETNLNGVFYCSKAFLPFMLERRWGRIVNISSVVGQMGNIGQANYASVKAAIIGFTKALAREVAKRGVTVNAVAPGFTETDMTKGIPAKVREKITAMIPLRRFAKPEEIAYAVRFLCTEEAGYITGQVIGVNGGLYM